MKRELRILLVAVPGAATMLLLASWLVWPIGAAQDWPAEGGHLLYWPELPLWIGITFLASAFPVRVPRGSMVSVSAAPIVAASILGGPTIGAVVAVIGTLELREIRREVPWYGILYNHSFLVFPAVLAGTSFTLITGDNGVATPVGLVGAIVAGTIYLLANASLSALAVAVREGRPYRAALDSDLRSVGLTLVGLTPIAWLMALAYTVVGPLLVLVFAVPLYTTRAAYKSVVDIRNMFTQTVRALASAIDARDPSTKKHSEHVSTLAVEIGQAMSLSEAEIEQLEWAGLLHDIGKIGIRDAVLLKPERLTREERMLMNEHPVKGEEILKDVDRLANERPLIRHHHEWFNGSGYPDRLIGEEIPLLARVLHVADAFEAMTAARPYRPVPLTTGEALQELHRYAGIQFDPVVVEAFSRTRTAQAAADPGDHSDEHDPPLAHVPTLGQVAARRAKRALPTSSSIVAKT